MSENVQPSTVCQDVQPRLSQSVGLWLDDMTATALQRAAQADDRNLSSYIRRALKERLSRDGFLQSPNGGVAA